jgi:hypothetical protein
MMGKEASSLKRINGILLHFISLLLLVFIVLFLTSLHFPFTLHDLKHESVYVGNTRSERVRERIIIIILIQF